MDLTKHNKTNYVALIAILAFTWGLSIVPLAHSIGVLKQTIDIQSSKFDQKRTHYLMRCQQQDNYKADIGKFLSDLSDYEGIEIKHSRNDVTVLLSPSFFKSGLMPLLSILENYPSLIVSYVSIDMASQKLEISVLL